MLKRMPQLAPLLTRTLASYIDKRFTDPRLRQVLGYPAVFLGGSPYGVPSLYHLMSHLDLDEGVLYPRGGFTTIIDAIARLARRARRADRDRAPRSRRSRPRPATSGTGAPSRESKPRATGVRLTDGRRWPPTSSCRPPTCTTPRPRCCPAALQTYPEEWWAKREPEPRRAAAAARRRGRAARSSPTTPCSSPRTGARTSTTSSAPSPQVPDPASIYVCRPSATDADRRARRGTRTSSCWCPFPPTPTLGHGGVDGDGDAAVEAAADRVIAQIADWCGIPDLAERIVERRTIAPADFQSDLHAWRGNALGLSHTLRQSAVFRPRNVSKKVDGLYYAGRPRCRASACRCA